MAARIPRRFSTGGYGPSPAQSAPAAPLPIPSNYQSADQIARSRLSGDVQSNTDSFLGLAESLRSRGFLGASLPSGGGAAYGDVYGGSTSPWFASAGTLPPPRAPQMPDTSAAKSAAYSRAKDQVGQSTSGAIAGLKAAMAGKGGPSISRGVSNIIGRGQGELADVSRASAMKDAELAQQMAIEQYRGELTQREQDMADQRARWQVGLSLRGQDMDASSRASSSQQSSQQSQWASLIGLWKALQGGLY